MRKRKYFSDEFKKQVVQEYLKRELTILDLMEKYSIKGRSCISNWIREFELEKGIINKRTTSFHMEKGRKKTKEEVNLESRIKELEKALEHEKLRSLALDTMIDIAEEKLDISIRKKPGTKR